MENKDYKVFKFDSRNTGFYVEQGLHIRDARLLAIYLSQIGAKKAQVEGGQRYFELYENGEKTEWSTPKD